MTRARTLAVTFSCLLAIVVWLHSPRVLAQSQATGPLTVHITSPMGRTGVAGSVRIVAQVHTTAEKAVTTVRFLVDGKVLQTVSQPPYAVDWIDDDPFLERDISVEAFDDQGHTAKDVITLKALSVNDETSVMALVLEASVFRKGRFVSGLTPADFALRENGELQAVDLASQDTMPVTYGLLIDSSQSMGYSVDFVRSAARRLATYLRKQDNVIVAPFTTQLLPLTGPTNDPATMVQAIGNVQTAGGTAILDAVTQLAQRMNGAEGRRTMILVTDGYDENSAGTIEDALKALHKSDITLYVVGIGGVAGVSIKGQEVLKRLAAETGGRTFFPWRLEDLVDIYNSLAVDVQSRYLLSYTPKNQAHDGQWRAIELATTAGDTVVTARKGYFADPPPPIRPTIEFTLMDSEQKYFDVTADDLVVFEDGVEQKVDSFHEAVAPVSVVLALDSSGSMRTTAQLAMDAARGFVAALRPKDSLGVLMFADRSTLMQDLSTNREPVLDAIGQYKAIGGTALYDALADSFDRLKSVEGRRAVVVVTDGRDEDNPGTGPGRVRKFADVLRLQKESGAIVYGVGVGAKVDRVPLETLAKASGGQAYFPSDASELAEQYQHIVENLRRRFALSYTSTNETRDGAWRKVEIRVRSSNLVVSSAGGYFAPGR